MGNLNKFKILKQELIKINKEYENPNNSDKYIALLQEREDEILKTNPLEQGTICYVRKNKNNGVLYIYIPSNGDIKEDDICVLKKLNI